MVTPRKEYSHPGQPTKYNPEIAEKICSLIATNAKGLNVLIKENNLPDKQTIFNWLHKYPEFFDHYMRAKENQAHVLVDKMLIIPNEVPVIYDKEGNVRIDSGMLGRAKLEMDSLRWCASILAPKFYSDAKKQEPLNTELADDSKRRYQQQLDEKNKKDY